VERRATTLAALPSGSVQHSLKRAEQPVLLVVDPCREEERVHVAAVSAVAESQPPQAIVLDRRIRLTWFGVRVSVPEPTSVCKSADRSQRPSADALHIFR
jgi:hypothetical protein